jgi:uncharacterized protein (TIGR02452 family)
MIKRDGVAVMNQRTGNVALAKETVEVIKSKNYTAPSGQLIDISASLAVALDGTVLYPHTAPIPKGNPQTYTVTCEVTNETTAQAAVRWTAEGKDNVVALNFASARNQGGGFLSGAIAQEEDLCRCSGLYGCLKRKPQFYNENILCDDSLYTDGIIYSPKVPFFRNEHNLFLEEPFEISIVSAPAPNVRAMTADIAPEQEEDFEEVLYNTLYYRAGKLLQVAALHGHKNIILGAWGCGAFGNDAGQVAGIFSQLVNDGTPFFENVCFAVYDTRQPPVLFETFKEVIESY